MSWSVAGPLAVLVSAVTGLLLLLVTLPSAYSEHGEQLGEAHENHSTGEDDEGEAPTHPATSVQVVVLGDIGRSPRMQYHALSIAAQGGRVDIIAYAGAETHPEILQNRRINLIPIRPFPHSLRTGSRALFLLLAAPKVVWQILSLYYALAYSTRASKWMLVQNPPSIPTLAVCYAVCYLRNTRLVIDWHNFGYSILALRLGGTHALVRLAEWYEGFFSSRGAHAHLCVTNAMAQVLRQKWGIPDALPLHDRPPEIYQPLSRTQREGLLRRLPATAGNAADILSGRCRLLVSSTSWTPDEDFTILLEALERYSNAVELGDGATTPLPPIIAIITGRGPQRDMYLAQIRDLTRAGRLAHVIITTAWLSPHDYAALLGSADLGVSLHTSSSGVDLPMKVVDMFGTGLPVVGWGKFEAWPELVVEGKNGRGFGSAQELAEVLEELFGGDGSAIKQLKDGAMRECERRWDDEWTPVAGKLFGLAPTTSPPLIT